jgi:drug/metabolite transporter (DMT)-like permease
MLPPGARYMLVAAFAFSLMTLFVKLAGERLPTQEVIVARALMTLLMTYAALRRAGIPTLGSRRPLLWLRGLFGFLSLSCTYYSVTHLPLAEATVIQYMNPLLVSVLAAALLRERPRLGEWVAIAVSLVGVLLIARPAFIFGGISPLNGGFVAVALVGSVFSSIAYVTVRQLRHEHDALVVVFYFPLVTVPLALPFAIPGWVNPTLTEWLYLACVGVTTQIAQVYLTRGLQLEEVARATTVGYLQIIFAAIWGIVVFNQAPHAWSIAGAVIIAISTLTVLFSDPKRPASAPHPIREGPA